MAPEAIPKRPPERRVDLLSGPAIHARVTRRYTLAVGLIALLVLTSGLLVGTLSTRHAHDSEVIAMAAKQRTVAMRIALSARDAVDASGADRDKDIVALREAIDELLHQHQSLRAVAGSDAVGNDDLRLIYQYLDADVRALSEAVAHFTALRNDEAGFGVQAHAIDDRASGALLSRLNRAVRLHEKMAHAAGRRIIEVNLALTLAILLLLALTVQAIFRPLASELAGLGLRLSAEASTDPLTGLLNRRAFRARLEPAAAGRSVGLMMIDLDWFKLVNDSDGHAAGDRLLCELSDRLRACAGDDLLIGRWGGDEFIAAIIGKTKDATMAQAAIVHRGLMPTVVRHTHELPISATVGVAWAGATRTGLEPVLAAADDAARRGKDIGRGTLYPALPEDFARLDREVLICQALERAEGCPEGVRAHMQPLVRLCDGVVVGMELLARWQHPQLGNIPPSEFIDIATRSGWMLALGAHIRRSGFAGIASLRARGHGIGRVAINLGQPELARDSILYSIEAELAAHSLPLSMLEIEITEDLLLDRVPQVVRERLTALRMRGARLALDDFGTGYAGMSQLLRLPLDAIKLDRSFADASDGVAAEIVRATVGLAQGLGLELVVEGIETEAQMIRLAEMGAHQGQGYWFTPALGVEDMAAWLDARATKQRVSLRVA